MHPDGNPPGPGKSIGRPGKTGAVGPTTGGIGGWGENALRYDTCNK